MSEQGDNEGILPEKRPSLSAEEQILLREFIDVQKQRIILDNRRTGLAEKALEVADAQDERKFQFASKTRDDNIALDKARLNRIGRIFWAVLGLTGVVVIAILGFFFLGNETQRAAAEALITPALIAIAGYGVIKTLVTALKGLIGR